MDVVLPVDGPIGAPSIVIKQIVSELWHPISSIFLGPVVSAEKALSDNGRHNKTKNFLTYLSLLKVIVGARLH